MPSPYDLARRASDGFPTRLAGIYLFLIATNLGACAWALVAFAGHPELIGTAVLAYSLGLRHGLDADHIAAIDNATRRLMQAGKRPVAVGFFFGLGHSAVVVAASVAIALAAHSITDRYAEYREIGAVIGTSASALFLFIIAAANLLGVRQLFRAYQRVRKGEDLPEEDLERALQGRGGLARLFKPLLRLVSKSWHLFPIGLLFALGFETATEISLFGLSAEASADLSSWSVLIFPALFAAAMMLVDTTDSVLMVGAYGWAHGSPTRKLFYNLTITWLSVVVALSVGGIELLGMIADRFELDSPFWRAISGLNANFGTLGYAIVGLFAASWVISLVIHRVTRLELD